MIYEKPAATQSAAAASQGVVPPPEEEGGATTGEEGTQGNGGGAGVPTGRASEFHAMGTGGRSGTTGGSGLYGSHVGADGKQNIRVVCRLRPMNSKEKYWIMLHRCGNC